MPRVVPSQIVGLIDQVFPKAKDNISFYVDRPQADSCATIIDFIEQLPPELLVLSGQRYVEFQYSVNAIKIALNHWTLMTHRLGHVQGLGSLNPISIIRNLLSECPDEFPSKDTAELHFIEDSDLRSNLELDISATNQALSNAEWKAATVLAGSVIEALLLWILKKHDQDRSTAVNTLVEDKTLLIDPGGNLDKWTFHTFIEVAAKLEIIGENTAQQARLAKGFRNLIHPGREQRLGQKCDRGTALAAVAAVEFVVRDLSCKSTS
jgi:hypothetical protein